MKMARTPVVTGLAVTTALALAAATSCSRDENNSASSSTPSSSPAAATSAAESSSTAAAAASPSTTDYSALLIKTSDVGPNAWAEGPPTANPGGVTGVGQTFKNPDGKRTIVDTIGIFADPSAAAQVIPAIKDELSKKINGAPQPVDIGSNGLMVAGVAANNSMEISEVVFTEGAAFVDLEFDSSVGNPAPQDVVLDLANKQDDAVKDGLPS